MGAITFSWGAATDIQIIGKHHFSITPSSFIFEAQFLASTSSAHTDAEFATAIVAANAYRAINKVFTLKNGSSILFTADPDANTGYLTSCAVTKAGSEGDTARSQILTVSISGKLPADYDSRAGRREASIIVSEDPSGLRTLTFNGTWTALTTPLTAKASYEATISTWISGWLTTYTVVSSGFWQRVNAPQIVVDEQNKELNFTVTYHEVKFTVDPSGDQTAPAGLVRVGTFSLIPMTSMGMPILNLGAGPGGTSVVYASSPVAASKDSHNTSTPQGSQTAPHLRAASRYMFNVQFAPKVASTTHKAYWTDVVKAWVSSTITSLFSVNKFVLESMQLDFVDAPTKLINASGTFIQADGFRYLSYKETITFDHNPNITARHILDGKENTFDLTGGYPENAVTQRVAVVTISSEPTNPSYLGNTMVLMRDVLTRANSMIGNVQLTDLAELNTTFLYDYEFLRTYLRVDSAGSTIDLSKTVPLGQYKR